MSEHIVGRLVDSGLGLVKIDPLGALLVTYAARKGDQFSHSTLWIRAYQGCHDGYKGKR